MKRKIALICMLTMVCSSVICACGGSAEAETEEAVVEEEATPEPTVEPTPTPEPTPEPTTIEKTDEEKAQYPSHSVTVGNFEVIIPDGFDTEIIENPAVSEGSYPEYSFGRSIDSDWPMPYCHAAVLGITAGYTTDDMAYNHGFASLKKVLIPESAEIITEEQNCIEGYYYALTRYYVPEYNSVTEDLYILPMDAEADGFAYIIENDRREYQEKTDEETLFVMYDSVKNYFGLDILGEQTIFEYADGLEQDWQKYQTQENAEEDTTDIADDDSSATASTDGAIASGGNLSDYITDDYVLIGPGTYNVDYQNIDKNHSVVVEAVSGEGNIDYVVCGQNFTHEFHRNADGSYYQINANGDRNDYFAYWPAFSGGDITQWTVKGDLVLRIKYDVLH